MPSGLGRQDGDPEVQPAEPGRRIPLKVAFLVLALAVLLGGGFAVYRSTGTTASGASPGSQFTSAWKSLVVQDAANPSKLGAEFSRFAVAVSRIDFPSSDQGRAHAVVRDALAGASDAWSSGAVSTRDMAALDADVPALFASLGLQEPH